MSSSEIKFKIIPKDNISCILPLLKRLDDNIDEETLKERLLQLKDSNYQCVGVYDGTKLIGMSGLWILNKYYVGKHLEPDNVYVSSDYRGRKIGHKLMQWVENYAKEQGCRALELNCYLKNEKGKKFWEKEGYAAIGIHYQKLLK